MLISGHLLSDLSERDQRTLWHPYTQAKTSSNPIPIIRGEGAYLIGADQRSYLDAISSWWVNLHGHCHPYIVEKISQQLHQLEHLLFTDFTHLPAVEYAERLCQILPRGFARIFYSDNGSTAVEIALKMAIQFWHQKNQIKKQILSFKRGFHGETFGAMSVSGKNGYNRPFWNHLFEVIQIDPPEVGREELSLRQLENILQKQQIGCFIYEPLIQGASGMHLYSQEGLEEILALCKKHEVLLIADEVMTGFGRTGPLFASERLSISPDLICLGKSITGGFLPLAVTACTEEIYKAFYSDRLEEAFLHGHSYTANPIACQAALANLDLLEEPICLYQRQLIEKNHQFFRAKHMQNPAFTRLNVLGTILVLEYATSQKGYFHPLRDRLLSHFLKENIIVRPLGNVLYIMPPYCTNEQELNHIYTCIEKFYDFKTP